MCYTIYERWEAQSITPSYYTTHRQIVCGYNVLHRETEFWCTSIVFGLARRLHACTSVITGDQPVSSSSQPNWISFSNANRDNVEVPIRFSDQFIGDMW
jgi:hypothetical protein